MVDISDDTKGGYRRIELLTGQGRRRRWSAEEKARIIEETLAPGAPVSDVAWRWQLSSQQVFTWWREARSDRTTGPRSCGIATPHLRADHHRDQCCTGAVTGGVRTARDRGQARRCGGPRGDLLPANWTVFQ